ncbi:hypothetical protein ACL02S_23900 [Nocardia sp. 004]|uniref:hypothetical protein n=1 Tax=Nocardia sp. 004 TaxID=3385978 RepID=UPI0039A05344
MSTAYTGIDRTALGTEVATDLGSWASLLVKVLTQIGHTPATADLVRGSDLDARLYNSLSELAEYGGRINVDQLHAALPVLLRPLLTTSDTGFPRVTDLLAAAVELLDHATTAWAITTGDAEPAHPDRVGGNIDSHLRFAASVLRQACTLIHERTKTV